MAPAAPPRAIIDTKFGEIEIELFSDKAPGHVKNFTDLAKKGFYDGTTFHRVIPGFMIQGGDPNTRDTSANRSRHGTGGPGYNIYDELNRRNHFMGALSMAKAPQPNTAGSQFFITFRATPHLDGKHTVFGRVIDGIKNAEMIMGAPTAPGTPRPADKVSIKSVTLQPRASFPAS